MSESNVKVFMDVTGASEATALQYLSASNNDLEVAINIHMENGSASSSSSIAPSLPSSSTHVPNVNVDQPSILENIYTNNLEDDVRAPIAPIMDIMVNPEEDNFRVYRKRAAAKSVFIPLRDFDLEARRQEEQMTSGGRPTSSTSDFPKRRRLEDLFRPPVDLCYCGNFQSARDRATERNVWLIVNVQEHTEFACQVLNRDVWSNPAVKDVIRKHFLFWQVSASSSEGNRFKTFYGVLTYPYVCIVDPRTGENKMQYFDLTENFHVYLKRFLVTFPSPLSSPSGQLARSVAGAPSNALGAAPAVDSDFTSINMSEEDQLALAIKNSLEDNNAASASASGSGDTESETETDLDSECEVAVAETYEQFLGSKDDEITKISLRLPDGTRDFIEWPCTSKIKALQLYISVLHPNIAKDNYKMLTTFPNKDLNTLEETTTLKEADLHPSAIVHIHIDDE